MKKTFEDIKIKSREIKKPIRKEVVFSEVTSEKFLNEKREEQIINELKKHKEENTQKSYPLKHKRLGSTPSIPRGKSFSRWILIIFAFSLITGFIYLLSTTFLKAKVTIVSKNKVFELKDETFTSSKDNGAVPFELMIVSDSESRDVVLNSQTDASLKSKGEITFYNEWSSTGSQNLPALTFISDENGKTYKTDKAITIPPYKLDSDKNIIPGEVTVGITAFLPGKAYDGSPEYFHVNSFKGTSKYNKIYAKLKTPLSGGLAGLVYGLDDNGKSVIDGLDMSSLKNKLMRSLAAQVPNDYILYPNATSFATTYDNTILSDNPNTKIEITGTLSAFLIKEDSLSNAIIKNILPDISDNEKSEILKPDLSNLNFDFTNKDQIISKDINSFDFKLNGNLDINWMPDLNNLKKDLIGVNKNNTSSIFENDPGISYASIKMIPFWSSFLPSDPKKIDLIIKKLTNK